MTKFNNTKNSVELRKSIFISKAIDKYGDKFDYSTVKYKSMHTKVDILCSIHGITRTTPHDHLKSKTGCKECGKLQQINVQSYSFLKFIDKAKLIHGNKYSYIEDEYTKVSEQIGIICNVCDNHFFQLGSMHLAGQGCSKCNKKGIDYNAPAILYYLSINNGEAYKIGITTLSVDERFLIKDLKTIEVLFTKDYKTAREAKAKEFEIINTFSNLKYLKKPLLSTGNSELFKTDILNEIKEIL